MKDGCCPPFDPQPWNETTLRWEGKRFVKDRVRSFLHIPLNFGGVMRRNMKAVEALDAEPTPDGPMSRRRLLRSCGRHAFGYDAPA
jgi:hypothetical protein